MSKTKVKTNKKTNLGQELSDIAKVLSGELQLRKREEELEKLKKKAVERQKEVRRMKVVSGENKVEAEYEKKVVQKIKLFEWDSPMRFVQPFNPKTFLIVTGVLLLFIMYLAVLGHYGLMASIIALLFLFYVMGTTPPLTVTHQINTKGIETLGSQYEWFMLSSFWFSRKGDQFMIAVETKLRYPGRLIMLVSEKDLKALFVLLEDKLEYKDIKKWGRIETMNFGEYIPIEKI
ncbi:hypothetical protein HYV12_01845 [Candidatus Dojkabacteria bacterium]|nr:hypothetical protein [Candidatus Dojkabacteria bacterium]